MFHKWHSVFVVLVFFLNVDSGSQWCQCSYGFATEHSKRGEYRALWLHAVPLEAYVRIVFCRNSVNESPACLGPRILLCEVLEEAPYLCAHQRTQVKDNRGKRYDD